MSLIKFHVEDENPFNHWDHLIVKNQVVLDLGCGKHYIQDDWMTTPEFFLHKGAKKVVGVDPHIDDIEYYKQVHPDSLFFKDCVLSADHLDSYMNNYDVTAVKMDIEGHERHLIESASTYPNIKHISVETHNRELFHNVMMRLIDLGFEITHVATFYPRVYNECNLIVANRP